MFRKYIQKAMRAISGKYLSAMRKLLYISPILCVVAIQSGYLDPIIHFLDSDLLTFKIATVSFSAYKLIKSVLLIAVLLWLAQFLHRTVEESISKIPTIKPTNRAILVKTIQIFIYFVLLLIVLDLHGMDLSAFAFLGGAIGLGVGFGLQKIASNFLSGLILLFEKVIKEGDLIETSTGVYGIVKHTGIRHVLVEIFNGQEVMIPNDDFITQRVTNWTHSHKHGRVEIKVGVSYGSDIEKACELMVESAKGHDNCSKSIAPKCYVVEFTNSAVELLLLFWIDNIAEKRFATRSDVMRAILGNFKEHHIIIPFPQYDIHIKK